MRHFLPERQAKLDAGARQYGEASFKKSVNDVLFEIEQEAIDVSGWSWVLTKGHPGLAARLLVAPLHVAAYALWTYTATCRWLLSLLSRPERPQC